VKNLEFTPSPYPLPAGERVDFLKLIINFLPLDGGRCEKIDLGLFHVIPAKAGIQFFQGLTNFLDPGFHRGDG
jgi:hypothetical protein